MTDIKQKALALVNEVSDEFEVPGYHTFDRNFSPVHEALCRTIEQHEQFKRQVSDKVEAAKRVYGGHREAFDQLDDLILPKPDNQLRSTAADRLVYASSDHFCNRKKNLELIDAIVELAVRAALAKRGLQISEVQP